MIQEWTWQLPTIDGDVDHTCDLIYGPVQDLMKMNKWVLNGTIELAENHLLLILTMKGHDRWWISKRAPYLIASVATRSGIGVKEVVHTRVRTPPNLKKARFRTEDGRRVIAPPDGSDPGPQLTVKPCAKCKEADYFYHRSGWKTGSQVQWGRGR